MSSRESVTRSLQKGSNFDSKESNSWQSGVWDNAKERLNKGVKWSSEVESEGHRAAHLSRRGERVGVRTRVDGGRGKEINSSSSVCVCVSERSEELGSWILEFRSEWFLSCFFEKRGIGYLKVVRRLLRGRGFTHFLKYNILRLQSAPFTFFFLTLHFF